MSAVAKASAADPILLQRSVGGVTTLTLNRPRQYNALSLELIQALHSALDQVASDSATRVIVITGSGSAFSAGHDLKEMRSLPSQAEVRALFSKCSRMMQRIPALPQPVIAAVNGVATAAGCQLVAQCDLAIAIESARGVNIGLFCSTPMVALSRNVSRKAAFEMLTTGEFIDAARARELGLVNRVVEAAGLSEATLGLAQTVANKLTAAVKIGKRAFYDQIEVGLDDAYVQAAEVMVTNMMYRDAEEGICAFTEKRKPVWRGE